MVRCWCGLAFLIGAAVAVCGEAAPYHQTDFPPEEFKARWEVIFDKIGNQAVAVVQGAARTNGFIFPRQSNEFYYLSGIETPGSYLLLDGRTRKATLYLPARDARLESAEGKVLSAGDADLVKRLTGADEVLSTEAMREDWLSSSGSGAPHEIYALFSPAEGAEQSRYELMDSNASIARDYWDGRIPREARLLELLRTRFWRSQIKDLTPILDEMRSVKSPGEIAILRRAAQIAGRGLLEAMRSTRPGIYEYQLEAAARYVYLVNGARLEGYRSIIAAGVENIWNMHYYRNSKQITQDDLILMDYAPDYHNYVSDITRMWPASGKFSATDRELLGFVLAYRKAVMQRIRPGVTPAQIREEAKVAMQPVFARTKFSKPIYEQAAHRLVDTGGGIFSHPVGLAVHDDGEYVNGPLAAGQVFSIDPQLRVPEESRYLRYEDVIVITSNGYENFTDFLPTELNDLETLVGQGGILEKVPAALEK
ncbi:MAG TPA: Xaa-Pro aminopeptidase [Terriglobales bacterium]|jgi:Xaa-Pro aminopeptidase|nr:Xaa-Pro aminopeptidase [Terriglobales bacterium]